MIIDLAAQDILPSKFQKNTCSLRIIFFYALNNILSDSPVEKYRFICSKQPVRHSVFFSKIINLNSLVEVLWNCPVKIYDVGFLNQNFVRLFDT